MADFLHYTGIIFRIQGKVDLKHLFSNTISDHSRGKEAVMIAAATYILTGTVACRLR